MKKARKVTHIGLEICWGDDYITPDEIKDTLENVEEFKKTGFFDSDTMIAFDEIDSRGEWWGDSTGRKFYGEKAPWATCVQITGKSLAEVMKVKKHGLYIR